MNSAIPATRVSEVASVINETEAIAILNGSVSLYSALASAAALRETYFQKSVRIHILDNIKNGNCAEDCGYCAQRKQANSGIQSYPMKNGEAIFQEAKQAKASGAYRFCLATAGTGPSHTTTLELAKTIRRITDELQMRVCLSAGFVDREKADTLAAAGLDRYNHNINTAEGHYGEICSTHTFADRIDTLESLTAAGVGLCSGVIVGLGETPDDVVQSALALKKLRVISIPVNFFIPVPGHAIARPQTLTPEYCLRVLIVFRLINPDSEIRIAAGREGHLRGLQSTALMVANSLFASGYLNVKGSNMAETIAMIHDAGFIVEMEGKISQNVPPASPAYEPASFPEMLKHPT
jgi:biotin synthase